jgi:hypothetical protein
VKKDFCGFFWVSQITVLVFGHPGHSVFTEPIGTVLRFPPKFGSCKIGTDRFLANISTEHFRFRYNRFGFGIYRKIPMLVPADGRRRGGVLP